MNNRMLLLTLVLHAALLCAESRVPGNEQTALSPAVKESWVSEPIDKASKMRWDSGHLITFRESAAEEPIRLFDRSGAKEASFNFSIPEAVDLRIADVTLKSPDHLLVSAAAISKEGATAYLVAEVDSKGRVLRVLRTNPFVVRQIRSDESDSFWAYGFEQRSTADFPVLRRYAFGKGLLQSFLPRSTLKGAPITGRYSEDLSLAWNGKTVGVYDGARGQWLELSPTTGSITKWTFPVIPLTVFATGHAFGPSGDVYASFIDHTNGRKFDGLFVLDKSRRESRWVPVRNTVTSRDSNSPSLRQLLGIDRSNLVYIDSFKEPLKLVWSEVQTSAF